MRMDYTVIFNDTCLQDREVVDEQGYQNTMDGPLDRGTGNCWYEGLKRERQRPRKLRITVEESKVPTALISCYC